MCIKRVARTEFCSGLQQPRSRHIAGAGAALCHEACAAGAPPKHALGRVQPGQLVVNRARRPRSCTSRLVLGSSSDNQQIKQATSNSTVFRSQTDGL